jgi:hypothetical protein
MVSYVAVPPCRHSFMREPPIDEVSAIYVQDTEIIQTDTTPSKNAGPVEIEE